jgi:hypothetical protein
MLPVCNTPSFSAFSLSIALHPLKITRKFLHEIVDMTVCLIVCLFVMAIPPSSPWMDEPLLGPQHVREANSHAGVDSYWWESLPN